MKVDIAGAKLTGAVVEVIEALQRNEGLASLYAETLDDVTRLMILDIDGLDDHDDHVLSRIRVLQLIRRDLLAIATPPDLGEPADGTTGDGN